MKRTSILLLLFFLPLSGAFAQSGSWTNQAGQVLSALPVEIKGAHVVFKKGTESVTYPLSVFLPSEQKRLKDTLGIVEVPAGLVQAHALVQRVLKRLQVIHAAGRLSDEEYGDACTKARQAFRETAAPFVEKKLLSEKDVSQLCQ
jgi:hypothetical protein